MLLGWASLARDMLPIMASSVSSAGVTITKQRNRISEVPLPPQSTIS